MNAAFPTYYKNVRKGVLPKPDMDLDGKIDISDYLILEGIENAYVSIGENNSFAPLVRRHPEILADIDVSQEAAENYKNSFDFNNNGISCDFLETECMKMYVFGELESQYSDESALCSAIYEYKQEHPETAYHRISSEKMEEFITSNDIGFTAKTAEEAKDEDIAASVELIKSYSSYEQVYSSSIAVDGLKGDVNNDGTVDLGDAVLIMQFIANPSKYGVNGSDDRHITEKGYRRADVDGEGVTNMDALTIQKYLLG